MAPEVSLNGWQVAGMVDLQTLPIRGKGTTDEAAKSAEVKNQLKLAEQIFAVAGDYSIERLYANLASTSTCSFSIWYH